MLYELLPLTGFIPEQTRRAEDGVAHLFTVEVRKREAIAFAGELVVRGYRVAQAARFANDGQGSVAHGDHLGEAARLEERRHEEHVRACVHALRKRGVEFDTRCHLAGIDRLVPAQRVLVVCVASAEDSHLDPTFEDALKAVHDQIHALLPGQTRDHDHKGTVVAHFEAQLLLDSPLADRFARHIVDRVGRGDALVVCRVVARNVDAVDDAVQDVLAAAQGTVEALTVLRSADLVGIAGRDRRDGVGIVDRAEHVVDGVGVAPQLACRRLDAAETQDVIEDEIAVLSLEGDVMDGIDGAHVFIEGESLVEFAQKHRRQSRVPIVAMQDIAGKSIRQMLEGFADGLGEERKALSVVKKAIRIVALEVALVVYEQVRDAIVHKALETAVLVAPTQGHVEIGDVLHLAEVGVIDRGVLRNHDDDLRSGSDQRVGEGARDIAKATRLNKRSGLRAREHHMKGFGSRFGHNVGFPFSVAGSIESLGLIKGSDLLGCEGCLGDDERGVGRAAQLGLGGNDVVFIDDCVFHARSAVDDAALHDDGVRHRGAALDDDVACEDGAAYRALDQAASGDQGVAHRAARTVFCGRRVVCLGHDGAIGVEQAVVQVGAQHLHGALVVRLLIEDAECQALEFIRAHVDAAELGLDCLEEVQVVDVLVVVDDLEQHVAVDDAAVEELVVAEGAAGMQSMHASCFTDLQGGHVLIVLALGAAVHHRGVCSGALVGIDDLGEVDVEDDVASAHDDVGLVGTLEERLVGDDVAQQEAHAALGSAECVAGKQEQAALLAVEHPVASRLHVVDERAVVARHHDADGLDAGVHHVGEREVDQAVAAEYRQGRQGTAFSELGARTTGIVCGDVADGFTVDHRFIPPSRSQHHFQRRRCPSSHRRCRA